MMYRLGLRLAPTATAFAAVVSAQTFMTAAPRLCAAEEAVTSALPTSYDIGIVGGGIVGLATAREIKTRYPDLSIVVLEKENDLASHQTGHNSGVIHCGIYYPTGSLKAKLCVEGHRLTYEYCAEHGIPTKQVGKLIVAVEPEEVPRLDALFERGNANGVQGLRMLSSDEITEMEPLARGLKAIYCPTTGIVDWGLVAKSFGADFQALGGAVMLNHEVNDFSSPTDPKSKDFSSGVAIHAKGSSPTVTCRHVISCGGLYADRLAKLSGCSSEPQIVPFRGEYLILKSSKAHLVKANVYPVPDPRVPFLGVHATPRMNGEIWLGPNAVLAFAREGYGYTDINFGELWEALSFGGLWKLIANYWAYGAQEMYRSLILSAQVKQLQRYFPDITVDDVTRGPAGVRAQAMDSAGKLVGDFIFDAGEGSAQGRLLHVRNAPSPAATSSLAIAKLIADRAESDFSLKKD